MIKKITLLVTLMSPLPLLAEPDSCINLESSINNFKEADTCLSDHSYQGQIPTKKELIDHLYLVHGAGSFDKIIPGAQKGTLIINTKRYFFSSDYKYCHLNSVFDGMNETENSLCLLSSDGPNVYFTPGRLWGMSNCPKYVIITPLKRAYEEQISISMDEFLTFNSLVLDEDTTIITWDDVQVPNYIQESLVSVIKLKRPKENPLDNYLMCDMVSECESLPNNTQGNKLIRDAIHSYICSKSGWAIEYKNPQNTYCNDDYCDSWVNGWINGVEITNSKEFLKSITTDKIPFAIAHAPNEENTSKHQRISEMPYGKSRNFGFEFFATFYRMQSFLDWKNAPQEMTKDLIEYFKAYLLTWELFSFENKDFYQNIDNTLNTELLKYEDLSLEEMFNELIKNGNYKFKSIKSCDKAFRMNFLKEAIFLQNDEETFNFIKKYAKYLRDNNIESPYSEDQLENILKEMYLRVQYSENISKALLIEVFEGNETMIEEYMLDQNNSLLPYYDSYQATRLIKNKELPY